MKKPLKESWLRYYVATPLTALVDSIKKCLVGGWYCEYCHKIHGRRVYKFKLLFTSKSCTVECKGTLSDISKDLDRYVCSLGKDQIMEHGWSPIPISLSDRLQSALSTVTEEDVK